MKKQMIANMVMVAIILVIVAVGIFTAGHILGWFDKNEDVAVLTDLHGMITVERDGVCYTIEKDLALRQSDVLILENGATAAVQTGDDYLVLNSGVKLRIENPDRKHFSAQIDSGEIFCTAKNTIELSFDGQTLRVHDSTVLLSIRTGAQSVSVLAGSVESVSAGQQLNWVGGEKSVGTLAIQSLNDFAILCIRNSSQSLCFTTDDLDALEAQRLADQQKELEEILNPTTPSAETTTPVETKPEGAKPEETKPEEAKPGETKLSESKPEETKPVVIKPEETQPAHTQPSKTYTCTITIRCDTILDNMDKLNPDKAVYVPCNGVILQTVAVKFTEGETAFDVLKRACEAADIQLEYSWQPIYNGYYVEGINHLYEKDCADASGWMYKVNGWFPNYTISNYILQEGDSIVLCYTCVGYGTDVGAPAW